MNHIAAIHRFFLRNNDVKIIFNKNIVQFEEPSFKKTHPYKEYYDWVHKYKDKLKSSEAKKYKPKEVLWKRNINIQFGENYKAKGYVGILEKSNPKISGFHYFRRGRCVEQQVFPLEMFQPGDRGSERSKSIYGEIIFENTDTTFNKRKIEINAIEMAKFEILLLKELKTFPNL